MILECDSGVCELERLQFLAHQSKISQRIELFAGVGGAGYDSAKYTRIGFFCPDENTRSGWQARELKTVSGCGSACVCV